MRIDTIGQCTILAEQARGGYTDAQSDIYSIGVTMFEMVTGTLPFEGDSGCRCFKTYSGHTTRTFFN